MCVNIIKIKSLAQDILSKQYFFYKIAYLTLTFDIVTLTLGQLQHLINELGHEYPIIRSGCIVL